MKATHYIIYIKYNILKVEYELDMNCDFSSNNNIWAWFYEFFVASILNFVWLFLL